MSFAVLAAVYFIAGKVDVVGQAHLVSSDEESNSGYAGFCNVQTILQQEFRIACGFITGMPLGAQTPHCWYRDL
jgi:hypothetical protein